MKDYYAVCNIPECDEEYFSNGYCVPHYNKIHLAQRRRDTKLIIHEYFGNKCLICKEEDPDVLNLDHINNDGYLDKTINGKRRSVDYLTIKNKIKAGINMREKYQLLCANCNQKKLIYHKEFMRLEKLEVPLF